MFLEVTRVLTFSLQMVVAECTSVLFIVIFLVKHVCVTPIFCAI
jgi:hypothetical protein